MTGQFDCAFDTIEHDLILYNQPEFSILVGMVDAQLAMLALAFAPGVTVEHPLLLLGNMLE